MGLLIKKGKNKKEELEKKKAQLEEFEELRRKYFLLKSNLSSTNSQLEDKKLQLESLKKESDITLEQIKELEGEIEIKDNLERNKEAIMDLKSSLEKNKEKISKNEGLLLEKEKIFAVELDKINENEKQKSQVSELDTCPLCKTEISEEHIREVIGHSDKIIDKSHKIIENNKDEIEEIKIKIDRLKKKISDEQNEISKRAISIVKLQSIDDKKKQLRRIEERINILKEDVKNIGKKKEELEKKISIGKLGEENYETLKLEVNELARSEERNLGVEITAKQRELDRIKLAIKQNIRDKEEISEEIEYLREDLENKEEVVEKKDEQAEILKKKYQKMFEQKNSLQDNGRKLESDMMGEQNEKRMSLIILIYKKLKLMQEKIL